MEDFKPYDDVFKQRFPQNNQTTTAGNTDASPGVGNAQPGAVSYKQILPVPPTVPQVSLGQPQWSSNAASMYTNPGSNRQHSSDTTPNERSYEIDQSNVLQEIYGTGYQFRNENQVDQFARAAPTIVADHGVDPSDMRRSGGLFFNYGIFNRFKFSDHNVGLGLPVVMELRAPPHGFYCPLAVESAAGPNRRVTELCLQRFDGDDELTAHLLDDHVRCFQARSISYYCMACMAGNARPKYLNWCNCSPKTSHGKWKITFGDIWVGPNGAVAPSDVELGEFDDYDDDNDNEYLRRYW